MRVFEGKTVFVTGSNRGIGRAIVEAFAGRGADIIAHARQKSENFASDMAELATNNNVSIRTVYFDLADTEKMKEEIKRLLKEVVPDTLVNNAGYCLQGSFFLMTPIKVIKDLFEINLFAAMRLTQLIAKPMLARKSGNIINIGSLAGIDMKQGMSGYGVAKTALMAWTKVMAAEFGASGVRVNAVSPGLCDTEGGKAMGVKAAEDMLANSAMHRLATPSEIARVACFLASEDASFINGDIIRVDGGKI